MLAPKMEFFLHGAIGIGEDHAFCFCLVALHKPAGRDEDVVLFPVEALIADLACAAAFDDNEHGGIVD